MFQVKLLSRYIKPKQSIKAEKQTKIKNRKLTAMGNRATTAGNYPKDEQMSDIDCQSGISC